MHSRRRKNFNTPIFYHSSKRNYQIYSILCLWSLKIYFYETLIFKIFKNNLRWNLQLYFLHRISSMDFFDEMEQLKAANFQIKVIFLRIPVQHLCICVTLRYLGTRYSVHMWSRFSSVPVPFACGNQMFTCPRTRSSCNNSNQIE